MDYSDENAAFMQKMIDFGSLEGNKNLNETDNVENADKNLNGDMHVYHVDFGHSEPDELVDIIFEMSQLQKDRNYITNNLNIRLGVAAGKSDENDEEFEIRFAFTVLNGLDNSSVTFILDFDYGNMCVRSLAARTKTEEDFYIKFYNSCVLTHFSNLYYGILFSPKNMTAQQSHSYSRSVSAKPEHHNIFMDVENAAISFITHKLMTDKSMDDVELMMNSIKNITNLFNAAMVFDNNDKVQMNDVAKVGNPITNNKLDSLFNKLKPGGMANVEPSLQGIDLSGASLSSTLNTVVDGLLNELATSENPDVVDMANRLKEQKAANTSYSDVRGQIVDDEDIKNLYNADTIEKDLISDINQISESLQTEFHEMFLRTTDSKAGTKDGSMVAFSYNAAKKKTIVSFDKAKYNIHLDLLWMLLPEENEDYDHGTNMVIKVFSAVSKKYASAPNQGDITSENVRIWMHEEAMKAAEEIGADGDIEISTTRKS